MRPLRANEAPVEDPSTTADRRPETERAAGVGPGGPWIFLLEAAGAAPSIFDYITAAGGAGSSAAPAFLSGMKIM